MTDRQKINDYRRKNQISFIIPKNDNEFRDLYDYIRNNSDDTHRDIYFAGLQSKYERMTGSQNKYDYRITEQQRIVTQLKKQLVKEEGKLELYFNEKEEHLEQDKIYKEKNFVNKKIFKDIINKIKKENPDELQSRIIRKFVEENYNLIDMEYTKQKSYKNPILNDHQRGSKDEDRIKQYVQVFMNYYKS